MELKIGTQLMLESTYTEKTEKFKCRVVEKSDSMIYIDYPINRETNKMAFLIDGAQFRVLFTTESKESYFFNTEVLGRKNGNIQTIILSCPPNEEFIKIQRRQYVRVETPVDIAVEFEDRKYQFVAEDISAGGTLVYLNTPVSFEEGDSVNVFVVLPFINGDVQYIETEATIVKIFEREGLKMASINFTNTDDVDKQQIVRFCFERQLLIRKKELNQL